ncbi:hypothetical protein IW261DRAFT_1406805 [Armillaria novae-zelandiae]|uniref:Uncharacterized protein n=1 Tax=Armillaria novae-zelandiae TaxID=153914 RepID=A0AA39TSD7_9AGAR|nr:hypothetical protein IW261DRAFT_1406805 [Armillaria novae-zelandiae]
MVLRSGLQTFKNIGTTHKGVERAFRILIPETAFLIWRLRCERRTQRGSNHDEVTGWRNVMSQRFEHGRLMADKLIFGPKATREQIVLDTWNGLIYKQDGGELLDSWIRTTGVLVGNSPRRNEWNQTRLIPTQS